MKTFMDLLNENEIAKLLKIFNYTLDKDKTVNGVKFSLYSKGKLISIFDNEKQVKSYLKKLI